MGKQLRTGEQLRAMVQVRMNAQPEVLRRGGVDLPTVGAVRPHECDTRGRNWDIDELRNGAGLQSTFRTVVDSLRDAYDLA